MGVADPESLRDIRSEVERMTRLVGDLLLLAQADAGNLPLARQPVELDTLLLEVLRESKILAGNVQMTLGEIDQLCVIGDRDRLKQVVLNLVSNALKFTPEGGRVTLGMGRINEWARLTISDTGVGIPPEELSKIFDRFYRVDKARSRAQGGAGLGLAIAQRIVQMHGGKIEAASEGVQGRGTTFSVWLPLARGKEVEVTHLPEVAPSRH
jgi:signal transduction histidine kinase